MPGTAGREACSGGPGWASRSRGCPTGGYGSRAAGRRKGHPSAPRARPRLGTPGGDPLECRRPVLPGVPGPRSNPCQGAPDGEEATRMCGIIGYVGGRPCKELILSGLERLEYRGYDSAGIALADGPEGFEVVRTVGNLSQLRSAAGANGSTATTGVGHTRWATHGRVTEANAHPHRDQSGRVAVVMNGIIENYAELRAELVGAGVQLTSETDAEVLPHLIARHYDGDLLAAVRAVLPLLEGHYALVA